ncbi:hypothetical protein CROQUDRAFT_673344 [Cronartium quercuum f. sp. fusiforme G11]|uniref:Chromo domain-containing protein n=1 Tax=Cronartium quercuum f. sp. fusiforme G11 TaxID=708437 RepID=A0A9P6NBW7_9BASI|nr:hypothetical protein CROQUDRAFT_673344 [Cronartium quercuum f. sp. fusiforme G11]
MATSPGQDKEFEVDYIIRHQFKPHHGRWEYLVKWKDYTAEYNTWEPKENLEHTNAFHEFINKSGSRNSQRKSAIVDNSPDQPLISSSNLKMRLSIEDQLKDSLISMFDSEIRLLSACRQAVNYDESMLGILKGANIVIWGSRATDRLYSCSKDKLQPNTVEFETLALWYSLIAAGGTRVKFGLLNHRLRGPGSIRLEAVTANKVQHLFIHRSLLNEIKRLKGLVELVKQPNYVSIYAFGQLSDLPLPTPILIQPIMMLGTVLIPTYNSILSHNTLTTKPFQLFHALQHDNNLSQLFIHPITACLLHNKYLESMGTEDHVLQCQRNAIGQLLIDLDPPVSIRQEELEGVECALLKCDLDEEEDGMEWTETDEVEGIVKALNEIRQVLHGTIRRFVMVVEDKSRWLSNLNGGIVDMIEVMSISEATEYFARTGQLMK